MLGSVRVSPVLALLLGCFFFGGTPTGSGNFGAKRRTKGAWLCITANRWSLALAVEFRLPWGCWLQIFWFLHG